MATTTSPQDKPFSVAIVGGGLGGVVFGIGLLQHNVPFHIYEAAPSFGEIGAGVAFGPNSVRALGLIAPGLLAAYRRHATSNESPELADTFMQIRQGSNGAHLFSVRGGKLALSRTNLPARCCVHRAKFLDEIVRLLPPGAATFGKSLVDIVDGDDAQGGPGYVLRFADGTTAAARVVVGCDGIRSPTRRHIHGPEARPVFAHEYAYRAFVPRAAYEEAMGTELTANGQLYVGRGGYAVTYPVEHGTFINMVASRNHPGSAWAAHSAGAGGAAWQAPSTIEDVAQDMHGWHPPFVHLLTAYGTRDKWALFDNQHTLPYYRGRICLLGDSAHATTPHLGAGAGMAMEDAYILSNLLGDCASLDGIEQALAAYDHVRRPRSQELVRLSRLSGQTYAFLDKDVGSDMAKMEQALRARYNWLWDADLEEHLAEARKFRTDGDAVVRSKL